MLPLTINNHLYAHNLPLRWLRIPLLIATLGLSAVCIAVGAQAIQGTMRLEQDFKDFSMSTGVAINVSMQDIRSVTNVLITVAILLAVTALVCILLLTSDWIAALRHGITTKAEAFRPLPCSTSTLTIQTLILAFLTTWLFSVLIPTTIFVHTRTASVTLADGMEASVGINTTYWNIGFLRCLAAAPWFSFLAVFPTTLLTYISSRFVGKMTQGFKTSDSEKR